MSMRKKGTRMLKGYVYADDGMTISMRALHTQMAVLNIHTDNIASYAVPGYQKKEPVITSFAEYLGPHAVDTATNTEIGRLRKSGMPLDTALASPGYFQRLNLYGGIDLSRDGRFRIDKDCYLRSLDGQKVLSAAGTPIRFPYIPDNLEKTIKINRHGEILLYDPKTGKAASVAHLGIASGLGGPAAEVDLKQGFVEESNVMLQQEYMAIMPLRREFEANRQMYIVQNDGLSRMIQELGRP